MKKISTYLIVLISIVAICSTSYSDDMFGPIIPKNTLVELYKKITTDLKSFVVDKVTDLKSYVDRRDTEVINIASSDATAKCEQVYIRAVIDAATNANAVSEAAIVHCVSHSDSNKTEVVKLINSLNTIHINDIIHLNETIDETKSELVNSIHDSTNEVLKLSKVYADQYANQAPGYTETKAKADASLRNEYNEMISSAAFIKAVKDTIGEFPTVVLTRKSVSTKTERTLPTFIELNSMTGVVYYTSLSVSSLTLAFSNTDINENGIYTWELMLSSDSDITSTTLSSSVNYVGNDKESNPSLAFKRIDSSRTAHVFAVRLIKIGDVSRWMIAYNYSFKG